MQQRAPIPAEVLAGVRAGDPAALAELCEHRGASVVAFCTPVCGPELAPRATAEALARFRAAVVAAQDPSALHTDELLLGATRHAAASLAPAAAPSGGGRRLGLGKRRGSEVHAIVPTLLAARAAGGLGQADQDRLLRHLERCASCREVEERFAQAERRYADSGPDPLSPELVGALVTSMAAAVPESVAPPPGDAAGPADVDEDPGPDHRLGHDDDDDEGWTDEYDVTALHEDDDDGPPIVAGAIGAPGAVAVGPDPELDHILDGPDEQDDGPDEARGAPIAIRGHPQATAPATAAIGGRFSRPVAIALPLAVVLLGAVVAMAVAGVFGGDKSEPVRSGVAAPVLESVRPPVTTPAEAAARAAAPKRARKRPGRTRARSTPPRAATTAPAPKTDDTPTPESVAGEPEATEERPATTPPGRPAPARKPPPQSATKVPPDSGGAQSDEPEPGTATTPTFEPAPPAP